MTLPNNFSPSEHLQDTIRRTYRREVREWFRDIDFDDPDLSRQRNHLAQACEHDDADSLLMTVGRMLLFETVRGRFANRLGGLSQGVGETTYKATVRRKKRPQIALYFLEDNDDLEAGYAPVEGRISFRLMNHTPSTITPSIAQTYAQRIKSKFALGAGFVWKKGRDMYSYTDWERGYQFQLLCRSEAEARRIVEATLDIQQHSPEWSYFNKKVNAEPATAFPVVERVERVYGKQLRPPRRRPIADVRFQYAVMEILGLSTPLVLVDRTGILPEPLVN